MEKNFSGRQLMFLKQLRKMIFVLAVISLSSVFVYAEESDRQRFEGFNLNGYTDGGKKAWDIKGDTADILGDLIKLTNITANAYGEEKANLTARYGTMDKASGQMHLEKDVVITSASGARMTTDSLDWNREKDLVQTSAPVTLEQKGMTATGTGVTGHPNLKVAQMNEDVTVKINTEPTDEQAGETITVTCDGPLEVEYEKQRAVFNKNVVAINGDRKVTADKIEIFFNAKTKQVSQMICTGNVSIIQGKNTTHSESAVYDAAEKKMTLLGSPKLILYTQKGGGFNFAKDSSEAAKIKTP